MILLSISIGLGVIFILLKPMSDGLMNTSMWVSKILAPDDAEENDETRQFLKVGQAALMDGWLSNIPFFCTILFFSSIIIGFVYVWWMGIVAYLFMAVVGAVTTLIWGRSVSYYLSFLTLKMANRSADYKKNNDTVRYEASESYYNDLQEIMGIYRNCRLKPPTEKQLKAVPYGDLYYWLNENNKL